MLAMSAYGTYNVLDVRTHDILLQGLQQVFKVSGKSLPLEVMFSNTHLGGC